MKNFDIFEKDVSFLKKKISEDIYLLVFKNQIDLTSTLLRFQEHFESPKFKDKIFSHKEFVNWYSKGKEGFTYFKDWSGFNFPSTNLKNFKNGQFK